MRKSISLVAGSMATVDTLLHQLTAYIDYTESFRKYAIESGIDQVIKDELVIFSSALTYEEIKEMGLYEDDCEHIVASRTINIDHLEQLVSLPPGTKVLLVNDIPETTQEVIHNLESIGLNHLDYQPYYPGLGVAPGDYTIAITPGERDKVPAFIEMMIDIGPRIMDFTSITKILLTLDLLDQKVGQFSQHYLETIISIAKRMSVYAQRVQELNTHLKTMIEGMGEGLIVYDDDGFILVANERLKDYLPIGFSSVKGKKITSIVDDSALLTYLSATGSMEANVFTIMDQKIIVEKRKMPNDTNLVSFKKLLDQVKESSKLQRALIKKGFYARYEFKDIVGISREIEGVKSIARKLGRSPLTILLEGESGTGKELFASAIHNESQRKTGPFLAVNFSALPDELIESELFGYEDGAFTGARKGGKLGLFEQADGGTIFLDEIGDISTKMQTKLLRVLQEKEIMPVGGNEIRKIDVRVIAATNKNLEEMVAKRTFREDLYYRLKMGIIKLPPLRHRKEDIPYLFDYFLHTMHVGAIQVEPSVYKAIQQHSWLGNVRELRNAVSYMIAVCEDHQISYEDLPTTLHEHSYGGQPEEVPLDLTTLELEVLSHIAAINKKGLLCGRRNIARASGHLTEHQVRHLVGKLKDKGYVETGRGKRGTILTANGEWATKHH